MSCVCFQALTVDHHQKTVKKIESEVSVVPVRASFLGFLSHPHWQAAFRHPIRRVRRSSLASR